MAVANGQLANETTFNSRLMSRTIDTSTVGRIDLSNALAASGSSVSNIQRELNGISSFTGRSLNGAKDELPAWASSVVGSASDDLKDRAQALTQAFILASGHDHDGTEGNGGVIAAASIGSVPLKGYFQEGTSLVGATGSSTDISTPMTGKIESTSSSVAGVPTSSPYNRAVLFDKNGSEGNDYIQDSAGRIVYGRITKVGPVWTLSYYVNNAGVETSHTLSGSTNIKWFYQELFNPLGATAPVYSELASIPSENATADVVDATASQSGKVSTSAQTFGGAKTFNTQAVLELGTLLKHQSSPSNPASGYLAVFAKSDNKVYRRQSDGTESEIGGGTGIGSGNAVDVKTADYTVTTADKILIYEGTSNGTFTLPAATSSDNNDWEIINNSNYQLTIATQGGDTFQDGTETTTVLTEKGSIGVACAGGTKFYVH
jgi:hypothetical protein